MMMMMMIIIIIIIIIIIVVLDSPPSRAPGRSKFEATQGSDSISFRLVKPRGGTISSRLTT